MWWCKTCGIYPRIITLCYAAGSVATARPNWQGLFLKSQAVVTGLIKASIGEEKPWVHIPWADELENQRADGRVEGFLAFQQDSFIKAGVPFSIHLFYFAWHRVKRRDLQNTGITNLYLSGTSDSRTGETGRVKTPGFANLRNSNSGVSSTFNF